MGEKTIENNSTSQVPGQVVLDGMAEEMGYEAIVLKPVQERFCWEYVLHGDNASAAYRKVKPSVKETTARVEGSKLLTNPDVVTRIAQIRDELNRRYAVTADDVLQYHGKVLKMDRAEFVEIEDGGAPTLKPIDRLDQEAATIVELTGLIELKNGKTFVGYQVPSRGTSAVELAKILGMNKERKEISGPDGGPIVSEGIVASDAEKLEALREKFGLQDNGTA